MTRIWEWLRRRNPAPQVVGRVDGEKVNRVAWNSPTRFYGQPVLTFGQRRLYRVRPNGGRWSSVPGSSR